MGYSVNNNATLKPSPRSADAAARWDHTALRRRLLDGYWEPDLLRHRRAHFDGLRDDALGPSDLSSNAFKRICRELAVLYDMSPTVLHDNSGANDLIKPGGLLEQAGLWSMMARFQRWCIGCNEYFIRPHITEEGIPFFRPVAPDTVIAKPNQDQPDIPVKICELRERIYHGRVVWAWDVLSIEDPDYPYYRILLYRAAGESEFGEDITEDVFDSRPEGDLYPYRDSNGRAVLPYVLYHASNTGRLFDTYHNIEVVRGSLTASVLYSFLVHSLRDASWPQRYAVNVGLPGAMNVEETQIGPRVAVPADPASIIAFEAINDLQPQIGQFAAGADVVALSEAISEYELRLAQYAGLPASDVQRVGKQARSGYSIALSNSGKREAQQQFRSQFMKGDQQLIALTAIMLNLKTGSSFPESGYSIFYSSIPKSSSEIRDDREQLEFELRLGLLGPLDAYRRLHPGTTLAQALAAMKEAQDQNKMIQIETVKTDYAMTGRPSAAKIVADLNVQVQQNALPRSVAIAQLVQIMGYSEEQARQMIQ